MEAISGRRMNQVIAAHHPIHPIQVCLWKRKPLDGASELFSSGKKTEHMDEGHAKVAELFQQIMRLQMELEGSYKCVSCSNDRELR
jgi:hypothetical protein